MRHAFVPPLALLCLALSASLAVAKGPKVDLISTAPDFASYKVRSIALLPVASYDKNIQAERMMGGLVGKYLQNTGYRWSSGDLSKELLRSAGGDSAVKAVRDLILKDVRLDSTAVPGLCARLRCDAVLALRIEQWEQNPILWNQAGKPMTTVTLKAALTDSTGHVLWTASGSETGEGPYHDPNTNPLSISSSGLDNTPVTGQGGPPDYVDVADRLMARWGPQFPRMIAPAPGQ